MRAVRVRARADLRQRFLSWLALALLVGITGGAAIAVASAAQRTDTAYTRFSRRPRAERRQHHRQQGLPHQGPRPRRGRGDARGGTEHPRQLRLLPRAHRRRPRPHHGGLHPHRRTRGALGITLDRWKLLDGRRFDPAKVDEAVLDYEAARNLGLEVGDSLTLRFIRRTVFDREIVPYVAGIPARVSGKGTTGAVDQTPVRRRTARSRSGSSASSPTR